MLPPQTHLSLPFFDDAHRQMASDLAAWVPQQTVDESAAHLPGDFGDAACRQWVARLGQSGWLKHCVPGAYGGARDVLDSRSLVVARETLAFHSPLADFAFAMQGLGSGAITLDGTATQHAAYLPDVAAGRKIAAFALSEPDAGSDVGAMQTIATRDGDSWVIDGTKTWISNGGIADFYCVFAKTAPQLGTRGISCFVVDATTKGLDVTERIALLAPHPLATLQFSHCRVPANALVGEENQGFKLAMRTLDIFRASVAAAAIGMARRALAEALTHVRTRRLFGQALAEFQLTQANLGDMAATIDAAALLTYRAAWLRDMGHASQVTQAAAMAKMAATEGAQQVIDAALQLHGGLGVKVGSKVEGLYRDIRSLRIYEGATEVQKLIIARELLKGA